MSIYIRLNKEINPQKLLADINKEINDHCKSHKAEDSILCINIRSISETTDGMIVKLENTLEKLND
jgi:hypothetical protein